MMDQSLRFRKLLNHGRKDANRTGDLSGVKKNKRGALCKLPSVPYI